MKHLIMGTAGHIDHGKTTLIKKLTNIDCDTHKEEKRRGITINLGFSHFNLPSGETIGIIDVPGHKDFIGTMLSGACGIDFVLMVIAADSGIMPQTIEHLNIIKALNVKTGIVALTKTDLVDKELVELAKLEVLETLEKYDFKQMPVVPVSSVTGEGTDKLIDAIQNIIPDIKEKNHAGPFRMYIDRCFSITGIGSVVTGSVISGKINTGDDVMLLPGIKKKLKIKNIERHGSNTTRVVAGDRAAINISGIKTDEFKKGMVLTNKLFETTNMIDAYITVFDDNIELKIWSTLVFYSGTFESIARVHILNKDKIKKNQSAIVQIHLDKPAILLNKDNFIIRNSSGNKTIGGGIIIDSHPLHHRKRTPELIKNLDLLVQGVLNENDIAQLIKIELKKHNKPLLISELSQILNKPENDILESIDNDTGVIKYKLDDNTHIVVHTNKEREYCLDILKEIELFHKNNKILETGMGQSEFAGKLGFAKDKTGKKYIEILLKKIQSEGKIKNIKNTWIIAGHKAETDKNSEENIIWLENIIKEYDMQKPVYADIEKAAAERKITKDKLKTYLFFLKTNNKLCFYKNEYIHKSVADKCKHILLKELDASPNGLNNSEIRKSLNSSKKLTPFLISFFESEGLITTKQTEIYIVAEITEKGKKQLYEN